jgi:phosphatidylglycerophosphatase A
MIRLAVFLATAAGAGYSPIAPGTVGSLVGLVAYLYTMRLPAAWQLGILAAIVIAGTWAASVAARYFGREDPGHVVIDEVAGQLLTLMLTGVGLNGAIAGFFLFRILDVVKPWPAAQFERLHGGIGIMTDDLMVAVYGNLILQAAVRMVPGVL